jgi:glutamine cyclotransferase
LNDLGFVEEKSLQYIHPNIYQSEHIAKIDQATGIVVEQTIFASITDREVQAARFDEVLNKFCLRSYQQSFYFDR